MIATTAPPPPTTPLDAPTARLAVTQPRVVRAEWIKLRSVHSTTTGFLGAAIVAVVLGLVFSSVAGDADGPGGGPADSNDPVSLSLAGFNLAQIIVGVLGALAGAGEYSTGLIRTTLAAVPTRLPVLWAKAAMIGAVTLVVTGVAALAAFLGGQAIYAGTEATASLTDPGALRAVLGTAIYCTGVAVIGVALGFLMRSTASATGILFAGLLVIPGLVSLLPDSWSDPILRILPSNAGSAFASVDATDELLSPDGGPHRLRPLADRAPRRRGSDTPGPRCLTSAGTRGGTAPRDGRDATVTSLRPRSALRDALADTQTDDLRPVDVGRDAAAGSAQLGEVPGGQLRFVHVGTVLIRATTSRSPTL